MKRTPWQRLTAKERDDTLWMLRTGLELAAGEYTPSSSRTSVSAYRKRWARGLRAVLASLGEGEQP